MLRQHGPYPRQHFAGIDRTAHPLDNACRRAIPVPLSLRRIGCGNADDRNLCQTHVALELGAERDRFSRGTGKFHHHDVDLRILLQER